MVFFDIRADALATPAVAGVAASIHFPALIPVGYRPDVDQYFYCNVLDNAAISEGIVKCQATGDVDIYGSYAGAPFTPAANCAFNGCCGQYSLI
jgi:hypothetical protein